MTDPVTPAMYGHITLVLLVLLTVFTAGDFALLSTLRRYRGWTVRSRVDRAMVLGLAQTALLALIALAQVSDPATGTMINTVLAGYLLFTLWPLPGYCWRQLQEFHRQRAGL